MTFAINLSVRTDSQLTDEAARDVAARWAHGAGLQLGLTSTSRDEPWLRVSAVAAGNLDSDTPTAAQLVQGTLTALGGLEAQLAAAGARVATWEAVEVLSDAEVHRRLERPAIPPTVTAAEFAELAGVSSTRIHGLESERRAGKRDDFPAPILDGHWLRSAAEHWSATRRRKPGPAPRVER